MSSRKEEKERRRQERLTREQAERERTRARRLYAIIAGGTLAAAAVIAIVIAVIAAGGGSDEASGAVSKTAQNTLPPPPRRIENLERAAKVAGCDLEHPPIEGQNHVLGKVKYGTNPPTSGNHYPIPTADGVYTKEPPATHPVHTLEHGRVEFQYSPSLNSRRLRQLGGLFNEDPQILVMFPNKTMPYRVAATAWGHLLGCKKVTDATFDAIRAFRDRYRDKGPEPSTSQPANF